MTVESVLYAALSPLVSARVYPDIAPQGVLAPYITYQQVGGESVAFLEPGVPSKKNARMQINVWAETRLAANVLARQVEDLMLVTMSLQPTALGSFTAMQDEDSSLYGTRQDFSLWFEISL